MQRDLTASSVLFPLLNTEREITTFHALLFNARSAHHLQ